MFLKEKGNKTKKLQKFCIVREILKDIILFTLLSGRGGQ